MPIARALLLLVALCGWAAFEVATDSIGVFVTAQGVSYIVFEQITVAASAIGFTSTKVEPDGSGGGRQATNASGRVRTAQISFTHDDTAPTPTGAQLAAV